MKKYARFLMCMVFIFLTLSGTSLAAYERLNTIVHLHSTYSFRGTLSPEAIVELARVKEIDAILFSDDALVKINYGIFGIEKTSVFKKGLSKYFETLQQIHQKNPNLIILPGLEVSPFYVWERSPFSGKGLLRDWNKHLLVYGLSKEEFLSLPMKGHQKGLFFLRGFPNRANESKTPYQDFIDDVVRKGGLVFWAHPEAKMVPKKIGPVTFRTDPYPKALRETAGYTGFAILFEGMKTIGIPGGIWDKLLIEYLEGKRTSPIWAIGELDFTESGRAQTWIDTVKTVLFVETKSAQGVLEALRKGRMYAVRRLPGKELVLHHFWVQNEKGERATFGESLTVSGIPEVHFDLSFSDDVSRSVRVLIIRNGQVIEEVEKETPLSFTYEDVYSSDHSSFYRLEIRGERGELILTNPIFTFHHL